MSSPGLWLRISRKVDSEKDMRQRMVGTSFPFIRTQLIEGPFDVVKRSGSPGVRGKGPADEINAARGHCAYWCRLARGWCFNGRDLASLEHTTTRRFLCVNADLITGRELTEIDVLLGKN